MLFNSPAYIFVFLPIVLGIYLLLNTRENKSLGKVWLVLASLTFYGYWNPLYLVLLISSIIVNFSVGRRLQLTFGDHGEADGLTRKQVATIGVVFNVGLLAYFKYADFFIENFNIVSGSNLEFLKIALPLAISFFTFQQIAFLIDCYKEKTRVYSFLDYSLFVTFFPQLIAGPIVHHKQMMPQFFKSSHTIINWQNIAVGITIFCIGLFKKVVIADSLAIWANTGFAAPDRLGFFEAWATSLSYTFQLYYDFSGYTDMAIGAALLFNIKLPINFNSPYKARNIQDFWRRWHITLSHWLRDYVYIAFGGSRHGKFKTYRNLFLTFLIGGLWHGAGWTFVLWGALHGAALVIHRAWSSLGLALPLILAWFLTFMFVNASWVFFRAESVNDALIILSAMLNTESMFVSPEFKGFLEYVLQLPLTVLETSKQATFLNIQILIGLAVFGVAALVMPNSIELVRYIPYKGKIRLRPGLSSGLLLAAIAFFSFTTFLGNASPAEFLYFNF